MARNYKKRLLTEWELTRSWWATCYRAYRGDCDGPTRWMLTKDYDRHGQVITQQQSSCDKHAAGWEQHPDTPSRHIRHGWWWYISRRLGLR